MVGRSAVPDIKCEWVLCQDEAQELLAFNKLSSCFLFLQDIERL